MFTSFNTALSALNSDATAIDVVGNNLANLNTTGYKDVSVSFHDLVTQSLGAGLGSTQVGFGVGTPVTLRQFVQGAIQSTGGSLDAAIQGDGFFIVKGSNGIQEYTRGGSFVVDTSGNLTMATGEKLLGWNSDSSGVLDTNLPIGTIVVPVGSLNPPRATTAVSVDLNLDASAVVGSTQGTFSTSLEVFDSLGTSHILKFSFTKTGANTWDYSVDFPAADLTSPFTPVTGTLTFDSNGILTTPAATDPPVNMTVTGLADGASDLTMDWSIYNGNTPRFTQFAQTSASSALSQNGSPAANLLRIGLADGGSILAQYSDGAQIVVAQLAMATIRNPQSLIASGNSTYQLGAATAIPAIGLPGSGGRGTVLGGSNEASNVDIAKQFTSLIVYQRGYQANTKVITTVDQISQDTIALKQ
jgi:flagellar hook protein FlgE